LDFALTTIGTVLARVTGLPLAPTGQGHVVVDLRGAVGAGRPGPLISMAALLAAKRLSALAVWPTGLIPSLAMRLPSY